ncbi:hypothetical protein EI94DRAFT_1811762 [Lactarius quietus]|nr:hypothetical protein EI94DRAFT_1811762 [Lactarius quietus]
MSPDVSCASDQPFTKLAQAAINTPSRICRSKHSRIGLATSIPPPIDASRSALDYKTLLKVKPLPLPLIYIPRSRPAEEALTNILKNMPPPSLQLYKKHLLDCLIQQKKPGVLSRVPGILAGCGFTVDSLVLEDLTINPSPPPHAGTGLVDSMLHVDAHDPARAPRRSVHSRARTPQGPAGGGPSHEPRSRRADEALKPSHKDSPPPFPKIKLPLSRSVYDDGIKILYNTPPSILQAVQEVNKLEHEMALAAHFEEES